MSYEAMIDMTNFGTIARYLSPSSRIQVLLHVKERSMLAPMAEKLDHELSDPNCSFRLREWLAGLAQEGSLMYSHWDDRSLAHGQHYIPANNIEPNATCEVIYMEPFYLVYTPGLFSGEHRIAETQFQKSSGLTGLKEAFRKKYLEEMGVSSEQASGTEPQATAEEAVDHESMRSRSKVNSHEH